MSDKKTINPMALAQADDTAKDTIEFTVSIDRTTGVCILLVSEGAETPTAPELIQAAGKIFSTAMEMMMTPV